MWSNYSFRGSFLCVNMNSKLMIYTACEECIITILMVIISFFCCKIYETCSFRSTIKSLYFYTPVLHVCLPDLYLFAAPPFSLFLPPPSLSVCLSLSLCRSLCLSLSFKKKTSKPYRNQFPVPNKTNGKKRTSVMKCHMLFIQTELQVKQVPIVLT